MTCAPSLSIGKLSSRQYFVETSDIVLSEMAMSSNDDNELFGLLLPSIISSSVKFELTFYGIRELKATDRLAFFPTQQTWAQALDRNRSSDFQCVLARFSRYVFPWLIPVKP